MIRFNKGPGKEFEDESDYHVSLNINRICKNVLVNGKEILQK